MRRAICLLAFVLAACSSSQQLSPDRPEVAVRQLNPLFFGSGYTAPVTIGVAIRNPAKDPIVVRRIRLETGPGMIEYGVRPAERLLNETLAPDQALETHVNMTATTGRSRLQTVEPLSLRAYVEFERAGQDYREIYHFRVVSE